MKPFKDRVTGQRRVAVGARTGEVCVWNGKDQGLADLIAFVDGEAEVKNVNGCVEVRFSAGGLIRLNRGDALLRTDGGRFRGVVAQHMVNAKTLERRVEK